MDNPVLTVTQLSAYLKVHRSTIYRLLRTRELPGYRVGSDWHWRFNREDIDHWMTKRVNEATDTFTNSR
jgi:excisionase family DNA binding protein